MNWAMAFIEVFGIAVFVMMTKTLDWIFGIDTPPMKVLFALICMQAFLYGLRQPKKEQR